MDICLDRTIGVTRDIMNGEIELPEYIRVNKVLGGMSSFSMGYSKVELPIEHIGLAYLVGQAARKQFTVKTQGSDGKFFDRFELVNQDYDYYIADCLRNVSPDALNWYTRKDGSTMDMPYVNSQVLREIVTGHTQCKVTNEQGQDLRELAITEAYKNAVGEYVETVGEISECPNSEFFKEYAVDFVNCDMAAFNAQMEQLKAQSMKLVPQDPTQN